MLCYECSKAGRNREAVGLATIARLRFAPTMLALLKTR